MPVSIRLLRGVAISIAGIGSTPKIFRKKTGNKPVTEKDRVGWLCFGEERIQVFRSPSNGTCWVDENELRREKEHLAQKHDVFSSRRGFCPVNPVKYAQGYQRRFGGRCVRVVYLDGKGWVSLLRSTETS